MTSTQQVKYPRPELNIEEPVINTIGSFETVRNDRIMYYDSICDKCENNNQKGIRGKL